MVKIENSFLADTDSFSHIDDNELLSRIRLGDEEAEAQLICRYSRLVRIVARPLFLVGGDSEDLIQEGMIGLLSAIRCFDPERGASFHSFAEFCIRNRLYSAIKSAARFKHTPLNDYVSFESPQFDESTATGPYFLRDPEDLFIAREHFGEITDRFMNALSKLEAQIMGFYLEGLSYSEIALKVNKSPKSVDNAVQRIRKKLTQSLKIGEIQ